MGALRRLMFGALVVVLTAGCNGGPQPPRRGPISGKVTLDGKPVTQANIRFVALEAGGVNAAAAVKDGVYEVADGEGPAKGKYRVEFSVPGPKRRVPNADIPGAWLEEATEILPPRYHRDSKFLLDYDPDNVKPYDVELKSK
jgi:hypothetical protein